MAEMAAVALTELPAISVAAAELSADTKYHLGGFSSVSRRQFSGNCANNAVTTATTATIATFTTL